MSMHVAWDMTHAGRIQTGTGAYARNLINSLESIDVRISNISAPRPFAPSTSLFGKISRGTHQLVWTQLGLRRELLGLRPDLVHAPAFVGCLVAPCPLVVTVHDMAYLRFPQHFEKPWLWYMKLLVPMVARRAKAVIAVSQHAKEDAERYLGLPPGKVHAVHHGVDHARFKPLESPDLVEVAARYSLQRPFVLCIGNLAARKNIPTLLKAVFRLKKANSWGDRRVVLVGGASPGLPGYADVLASIEKLDLRREVVLLGHVPGEDLPAIYNLAEMLAMPSLHEGFGLPVVEAMACGRPVVASNCASLPEIAGDAAILVDPRDSEAWAQALSQVLTDEALRQSMVERGLARAGDFTWGKAAAETREVYRSVLGVRPARLDMREAA